MVAICEYGASLHATGNGLHRSARSLQVESRHLFLTTAVQQTLLLSIILHVPVSAYLHLPGKKAAILRFVLCRDIAVSSQATSINPIGGTVTQPYSSIP